MAHGIVNNEMAFKGTTPWHGLGVRVNEDATGDEMLVAAKMDWPVEMRTIAMRNTDVNAVNRNLVIPGYKAVTRGDNQTVFQIATERYHPVQNRQIIDLFRAYCEAGHATMETVGSLHGGAVVWALARLNGGSTATIMGNDELRGYLLLSTSHDGTIKTTGRATQIRVVCANTLGAANADGKPDFALKHNTKWTEERANEARTALGMASEAVVKLNEDAAKLAAVSINESDWLDFMSKLMGETNVIDPKTSQLTRVAEEIKTATILSPGANLASARGTLWGAVNGVTYYADHTRGRTQDNRLMSAWFGDSDLLKRSAMNTALEMAGV